MEQKIITASSAEGLNKKIEEYISKKWNPVAGHIISIIHIQKRFAGNQHKDTIYDREYSQTMRKI
tara:strand:- start:337 stop:531 length:195 start_codon:yes stop_codon:yes gene_type:complete